MSFTFIDLFAGIGGFHAALSPLGGEVVLASEIDKYASKIYEENWLSNSEVAVDGDIRSLVQKDRVIVPKHDVLTAGFPCQPFSKSGNQLGVNEARGTLFYDIARIIETKKPKIVLLENVRNLIGPKHHSDYLKMIRILRNLGYAISETPTILSPHEIPIGFGGTPQHRQRVFIGGIRVGESRAHSLGDVGPLLDKSKFRHESTWNIRKALKIYESERTINKKVLKISPEQHAALIMWNEFLITYREKNGANPPGHPLWTEYWKSRSQVRITKDVPEWKQEFILKNVALFEANQVWIERWKRKHHLEDFIPSYRKFEWQGRNRKSVFECLIQYRPSGIRVKEPNYVPTFVALAQTPVLGWELREISEYEAGRLQGFPKGFEFNGQRRNISMKQIGNAVHAPSARLVFRALVTRAEELGLPWAADFITTNKRLPRLPEGLVIRLER